MLSVNNMLNNQVKEHKYKRPAVLNITSLLNDSCSSFEEEKSPSLSPSLTSSPASVSSFHSFEKNQDQDYYQRFYHRQYQHRQSTCSLTDEDDEIMEDSNILKSNKNIKEQVYDLIHQVNNQQESNGEDDEDDDDLSDNPIKAKRRRANTKQLEVLNRVFDRTFFPSTQMRAELGRQLSMSPRTVQIWFQNRRQAMRTRERQRLIKIRNNNDSKSSLKN